MLRLITIKKPPFFLKFAFYIHSLLTKEHLPFYCVSWQAWHSSYPLEPSAAVLFKKRPAQDWAHWLSVMYWGGAQEELRRPHTSKNIYRAQLLGKRSQQILYFPRIYKHLKTAKEFQQVTPSSNMYRQLTVAARENNFSFSVVAKHKLAQIL